MNLLRILLTAALAFLPLADASAAVVQIQAKDSGGTARSFNVTTTTDITGNLSWNNIICDQATGATCASVGTVGSPSTNALTVQAITLGHGVAANAMRVELPTDGTGQIGTVTTVTTVSASRTVGNAGAVMDFAGQNASAPANALQVGCQFQTTPTTITAGNASPCQMDNAGNLLVNVKSATGVAENTAVGTLTFSVLGGEGLSTEKTAVTTGNYGRLVTDLVGKLIVMPYAPNQLWVKGTTAAMTGTTSTQLIAAVASNRIYLTTLTCGNSHATVGTFVNVQDGSGGTTLWTVPAAAVYGGTTLNFSPPIPTTNGNGVFVADATTGANVICSGSGYSGV